ncbi:MAG: hypothetical protein ISR49_11785 [Alphaproteobacteria bacterium]|nr:hypothetical protein [Alphaproteobacteria bacterium]
MRLGDGTRRLSAILAVAGVTLLLAAGFFFPQLRAMVHQVRLVAHLTSSNVAERLYAAVELGRSGDERALQPLVAYLERGDAVDARAESEVVSALCRIAGPNAVRLMDAALREPASDHTALIESLACIDDAASRAILAKALRSRDLSQVAVSILSESHDQGLIHLLIEAETQEANRLQIILSLTNPTGHPLDARLTEVLLAALKDKESSIRTAAAESLTWNYLNGAIPAGALAEAENTEDADVRMILTDRLSFYGPAAPYDSSLRNARATSTAGQGTPTPRALDASLAAAAKRASAFLAAHQDMAGYWLTSRTLNLSAEHPFREKNTYLTPMIVDMLAPIADAAGLGSNLSRARRQIGSEIEDTGLVRYYGQSDQASAHGRIACAISPDADDTALAWRIAPRRDMRLLRSALTALQQYRAPNGLYRTWLAPLDSFRCIDRGSDPDPTDVGIQMHMLMFLAQASPVDGRALCAALRRMISDNRIWIYYRLESLIPIVRQPDLARAGCAVQLPEARLRTVVSGQGKWIAAGMTLARLLQATGSTANLSETDALLYKLAQGNFLAIRRSPPLIYQNDATGSAPGFYWSQEFGYALWLRLYFESIRGRQDHSAPGVGPSR